MNWIFLLFFLYTQESEAFKVLINSICIHTLQFKQHKSNVQAGSRFLPMEWSSGSWHGWEHLEGRTLTMTVSRTPLCQINQLTALGAFNLCYSIFGDERNRMESWTPHFLGCMFFNYFTRIIKPVDEVVLCNWFVLIKKKVVYARRAFGAAQRFVPNPV